MALEKEILSCLTVQFIIDNMVARKLLYKQLKQLGFSSVVCAINGQEAIDMYTEREPGYFKMAFFDHHMPKVLDWEQKERLIVWCFS